MNALLQAAVAVASSRAVLEICILQQQWSVTAHHHFLLEHCAVLSGSALGPWLELKKQHFASPWQLCSWLAEVGFAECPGAVPEIPQQGPGPQGRVCGGACGPPRLDSLPQNSPQRCGSPLGTGAKRALTDGSPVPAVYVVEERRRDDSGESACLTACWTALCCCCLWDMLT
uniref:Cysteine-rich and transmembrane domain-containing protein 1 n=1 Tax=Coturnix japonica TaxID=93934 RepID=A0A8C2YBP0_COTJA